MLQFGDPTELSPDQRRRELAGIFATGVLRLHQHRARSGQASLAVPGNSSKSAATRLEVPDETVLSVHTG
jgi:hypothetical protein